MSRQFDGNSTAETGAVLYSSTLSLIILIMLSLGVMLHYREALHESSIV